MRLRKQKHSGGKKLTLKKTNETLMMPVERILAYQPRISSALELDYRERSTPTELEKKKPTLRLRFLSSSASTDLSAALIFDSFSANNRTSAALEALVSRT